MLGEDCADATQCCQYMSAAVDCLYTSKQISGDARLWWCKAELSGLDVGGQEIVELFGHFRALVEP